VRSLAEANTIEKCYESLRIDVPIAPGLGLILEEVHYDKYNNRYGNDGFHDTMTFDDCSDKIKEFREKYIFSNIIRTEKDEKSMLSWLGTLSLHTYDVRPPELECGNRSALGKAKVLTELTDDERQEFLASEKAKSTENE